MNSLRLQRERGSSIVEFAFTFTFMILPLFLGTLTLGMSLVRSIQMTELCRNAARAYFNGTDFSQATAQNLLAAMAPALNLSASGGNTVIYLTTVTNLTSSDCSGAGYSSGCTNSGKNVFVNRLVIGNTSVHSASSLGTPPCSLSSNGNVSTSCEYTDSSDQVSNFSSVMTLGAGESAYVAEIWITSPDISYWSFLGTMHSSARAVFGE
ncbi:MAG: pilus assembly protein [Acidobacteriaceae bacterium]|nr:pilus assembly protein [Acidobacteriaceae bacterium]